MCTWETEANGEDWHPTSFTIDGTKWPSNSHFRDRNGFQYVAKSAKLFKSATEERDPKKASFTFSRGLQPKARQQNFATEASLVV